MHPHIPLRGAVARTQRGANMLGLVLGAVVGLLIFAIVVWLFRT
jgi:tetrahydromethanopterin S-methyltransferase subunit G